ncbi:MAG: vanadium-dependent haloperoxidase [Lautropia sp.]
MDVLLEAIRKDYARPVVHARNLFHVAAAMYDAWAAFDLRASPYLHGRERAGYACTKQAAPDVDIATADGARQRAISHAAYRLIRHRFAKSPGWADTYDRADALIASIDPAAAGGAVSDPAAVLGRHIADCYIAFGLRDGSNEANDYANLDYLPVNPPIRPVEPGNPTIVDRDRWQPVSLTRFVDQAGNVLDAAPSFLGPEWGRVEPFALAAGDRDLRSRDGASWPVWLDPGPPPRSTDGDGADYAWTFSMVSVWASHLDPADGVVVDISPGAIGNIGGDYLDAPVDPRAFFRRAEGGDPGTGRARNPATGSAYAPQRVPRGDYTRVLAEFWADGPQSETPPGHWFVILNGIVDHPALSRRIGTREVADPLEWMVKTYFALGGAMHDAAIAAWSVKGWYDTVRPLSAIRAMAAIGQRSDPAAASYSPQGIVLEPGLVELVAPGDPLAGAGGANVGKIKLYTWRGPAYVADPRRDVAGVGWILAENWWPYQRPDFVTPPFAGYVSGHSTYSSAAATLLERLTGDAYFPGGLAEFVAPANTFLRFERGPSVDVKLQWATYRDAADQCSLSRIWGGIHPPADDLPGRRIGRRVGESAWAAALGHFEGTR